MEEDELRSELGRARPATHPRGRAGRRVGQRGAIGRSVKVSERIAAALVADIVSDGSARRPASERGGDARALPGRPRVAPRGAADPGGLRAGSSLQPGPGGGPIVCAIDPRSVSRTFSLYLSLAGATITEVQESRLHIEPMIARTAAEEQVTPLALARLRQALDDEEALPLGDPSYTLAANNFHLTLGMLSGNKVLNLLATALRTSRSRGRAAPAGRCRPPPLARSIRTWSRPQARTARRDRRAVGRCHRVFRQGGAPQGDASRSRGSGEERSRTRTSPRCSTSFSPRPRR